MTALHCPSSPPAQFETLESEIVTKLTEVTLLSAENDSLRARETVLQSYVDDSTMAAQLLEEEEAREEAERAAAERAVDLALSMHSALSLSSDGPIRSNSGGSVSLHRAAATPPPPRSNSAAAGTPPAAPQRSGGSGTSGASTASTAGAGGIAGTSGIGLTKAVLSSRVDATHDDWRSYWPRYISYMQRARRERMAPDGSVAPLPAGDPRRQEYWQLIDEGVLRTPSGQAYTLMMMNVETGEQQLPPEGLAARAVQGLKLE